MGGVEDPNVSDPMECPLCHYKEVIRIYERGQNYQCQRCSHKFPGSGEPLVEPPDFDFPSPEDHDLQ